MIAIEEKPAPKLVKVCAWCPDKEERDAEIIAAGNEPTHGACDACYAKQLAEVLALG